MISCKLLNESATNEAGKIEKDDQSFVLFEFFLSLVLECFTTARDD